VRGHTTPIAVVPKPSQALVPEARDHGQPRSVTSDACQRARALRRHDTPRGGAR
jgi:hypothetical protein